MRTAKFLLNVLIWILFAIPGISANISESIVKKTSENQSGMQVKTYFLSQVTALPNITLLGKNAAFTLYLPINIEEKVEAIVLHLILTPSPILKPESSLTLIANDLPINTSPLVNSNNGSLSWDVEIPKELFTSGTTITLKIAGYLLTNNPCFNHDPGTWLTIAGNSSIEYRYTKRMEPLNLGNLPYPFIQKASFEPARIILSWPAKSNLDTLEHFIQMTTIFMKNITWRGLDFSIINQADLLTQAKDQPIIMVGTFEQLQLKTSRLKLPLKFQNEQLLTPIEKPVDDNTGILMVTDTASDPSQTILIITGKTQQAVHKAIEAFELLLSGQLHINDDFLLVENILPVTTSISSKNYHTFKDLGYENQVIYGPGTHTMTYFFPVKKYLPTSAALTLNFNHSLDLLTEQSYLTVKVNGIPIESIRLPDNTQQPISYFSQTLSIPPALLFVGRNQLDFEYSLQIPAKECARNDLPYLWGTILNSSQIKVENSGELPANQISSIKTLMEGDTFIALSDYPNYYNNKAFVYQLLNFIKNLNNTKIQLISPQQINATILKKHNLIYIGNIQDNHWLNQYVLFNDNFYKNPHLAYIKLLDSPLKNSKILILSSQKIFFYEYMLQLLNTQKMNEKMTQDTVLLVPNQMMVLNTYKMDYMTYIYYEIQRHWLFYAIIVLMVIAFMGSLAFFLGRKK